MPTKQKFSAIFHNKRKLAIILTAAGCALVILIVTLCSVFLAGGTPGSGASRAESSSDPASASSAAQQTGAGSAKKPVYIDPDYDGITGAAGQPQDDQTDQTGDSGTAGTNQTDQPQVVGKLLLAADKQVLVGKQVTLTAQVLPSSATNKTLSWHSSDSAIATVHNGVVTGKQPGTAVITATSSNGKTAKCTITVRAKTAYDSPYDTTAIYNELVAYGIEKGLTLDTTLTKAQHASFEEYTGDGWYEDAPQALRSKCLWMLDNAVQAVTERTGSTENHRFSVSIESAGGGEYRIFILYA